METIDKRTKEYRDGLDIPTKDYSKVEDNPGFKLCMKCGAELPPNEDGSEKFRRQPEACHACVYKNYTAPKKKSAEDNLEAENKRLRAELAKRDS